jgi:glycosyltransferase involved in cell wall biosynthesis
MTPMHGAIDQLTVGIPVCNAMPYLRETMESLFSQTASSFQILAIVDGGTDESLAYLGSLRDPRLRILVQPNTGLTATLNRMLLECRTPWLVRQDADDISYPRRLATIADAIGHYPGAGMFYSHADYHPHGRALGSFRCSRGSPEELRERVRAGYLLAICHSTVVLNARKTLELGGYGLGMHNEDADLWWRMALAHDIHCITEPLVGFRQTASSVSSTHLEEQILGALYVQYRLLSHLWRLPARTFEQVREHLEKLMSRRAFCAKEHLRNFNMQMSQQHYAEAILALGASFRASPAYLVRRVSDEFLFKGCIVNGIHPRLYLERKNILWPTDPSSAPNHYRQSLPA